MDAYHSYMLGCSYFTSPDYLVVKAWFRAPILSPSFTVLTGINVCVYVKLGSRLGQVLAPSVPCQCIMAMVDVAHPFVMTAYPSS